LLFPTYKFVFFFLPVVFILFRLVQSRARRSGAGEPGVSDRGSGGVVNVLLLASLVFYLLPHWPFAYVILTSIGVNFLAARWLTTIAESKRKQLLVAGIIFNLAILVWFKYTYFIASNLNEILPADRQLPLHRQILPVGISFYTFQQIALLADIHRERKFTYNLREYALFVTFFPQLIAGPIVHHNKLMPQISRLRHAIFNRSMATCGLVIFFTGAFKKVALADNFAPMADAVFSKADAVGAGAISALSAWMGALSYTLQIYFDFSGYSDMAIGLGLIFGLQLPINFLSPYKSVSIIDFWRRWHITLSTFLRDYLYIPLGGNRKGKLMRYRNLILTMLLGGFWHGAGWNFIIWGGLHGGLLVVNHGLDMIKSRSRYRGLPKPVAVVVTLLAVIFAWVYFRAGTLSGANQLVASMFGLGGTDDMTWFRAQWVLVAAGFLIVWSLPNVSQIFRYRNEAAEMDWDAVAHERLGIAAEGEPKAAGGRQSIVVLIGVLIAVALALMPQPSVFLYFNF
jgi:alginate O-acetyltransferase complex protein AlgI